jgi:hypothetical protein
MHFYNSSDRNQNNVLGRATIISFCQTQVHNQPNHFSFKLIQSISKKTAECNPKEYDLGFDGGLKSVTCSLAL